ncbi:fluoride efflux transporter CrcB [Neobacillus jeddahensis]|uniref:fluoride efflux transporter CrcB n=1 Tax=Neobacillus jeddahensis TaxID=1461580 RepID=UPI00058FEC9A|nr:fluoride efflux transporter CrcB [Neobacillus jeddahensis]
MSLFQVILVGIGGFFGAIARFSGSQVINKRITSSIPIATLSINLLGSFLLGLLFGMGINKSALLLLGTGFMGAFTTFSTFKLEGIQLHISQQKKAFLMYTTISYGGGILLAFLGLEIGRFL